MPQKTLRNLDPKGLRVWLPKELLKYVNYFNNNPYFFSNDDGYWAMFTAPDDELRDQVQDRKCPDWYVGSSTLVCKFKRRYFPKEAAYIAWTLIDKPKLIYKLTLYNANKEELKFILPPKPPWLC